jgi:hypothetical protein
VDVVSLLSAISVKIIYNHTLYYWIVVMYVRLISVPITVTITIFFTTASTWRLCCWILLKTSDSRISVATRMHHNNVLLPFPSCRYKATKQYLTLILGWFLRCSVAMPCTYFSWPLQGNEAISHSHACMFQGCRTAMVCSQFSLVTRIQHNTNALWCLCGLKDAK